MLPRIGLAKMGRQTDPESVNTMEASPAVVTGKYDTINSKVKYTSFIHKYAMKKKKRNK
jgi:hypothetical protein